MNCANCGAPKQVQPDTGIIHCVYCRTTYLPGPTLDDVVVLKTTDLVCPCCKGILALSRCGSHELTYCETCRGMLVAMASLMPIVDELRLRRDRPASALPPVNADNALPRICPCCLHPMTNHHYMGPGNVIIDSCSVCQVVWLDKGELQRMVIAPDYHPPLLDPMVREPGIAKEERSRSFLEFILD